MVIDTDQRPSFGRRLRLHIPATADKIRPEDASEERFFPVSDRFFVFDHVPEPELPGLRAGDVAGRAIEGGGRVGVLGLVVTGGYEGVDDEVLRVVREHVTPKALRLVRQRTRALAVADRWHVAVRPELPRAL